VAAVVKRHIELGLTPIAYVEDFNAPSQALFTKLGFEPTITTSRVFYHPET
jgi:predicted GNAT family acetyltransferase